MRGYQQALERRDKKRSYTYKSLHKCEIGENVNFYAVVLDATFPHQSYKSKKYLATFKIADATSRVDGQGVVDFMTIVFFADKFDDLPICQRIGDIIRVHRSTVSTYRDRKQLTANVCFNSSWALFPLHFRGETETGKAAISDEFGPKTFFGKSVQVEREEHTLIRSLRKWAINSFANKKVLSSQFITRLDEAVKVGMPSMEMPQKFNDFDVQVKIVQLFIVDQYKSEMRVIDDSQEIWHCQIFNNKYPGLQEGQYVRIRGCTLYNFANKGYERTFGLRAWSNIQRLPFPCKLAQDMMFDEMSAKNEFEVQQLASSDTIMHPVVISRIKDKDLSFKPVSYLSRVNEESKKVDTDEVHRVRVNVLGFKFPSGGSDINIKDCIRICDSKSGKSRAADGKALKKGEVHVFSLPLYVKDFSNIHGNKVNVCHLIDASTDSSQSLFPGIVPADLVKNKQAQTTVLQILQSLLRFNVHLEAALTVSPDGLMMITSDLTQMKIY